MVRGSPRQAAINTGGKPDDVAGASMLSRGVESCAAGGPSWYGVAAEARTGVWVAPFRIWRFQTPSRVCLTCRQAYVALL